MRSITVAGRPGRWVGTGARPVADGRPRLLRLHALEFRQLRRLHLKASGNAPGGIKIAITTDTLRLTGGGEEDCIDAKGDIKTLSVGNDATIKATGTFTSGTEGSFWLWGDCDR